MGPDLVRRNQNCASLTASDYGNAIANEPTSDRRRMHV